MLLDMYIPSWQNNFLWVLSFISSGKDSQYDNTDKSKIISEMVIVFAVQVYNVVARIYIYNNV